MFTLFQYVEETTILVSRLYVYPCRDVTYYTYEKIKHGVIGASQSN